MNSAAITPLIVLGLDRQGDMNGITPTSQHLLGWKSDDLQGRPLIDLIHPDNKDVVLKAFAQVLDGIPCKVEAPLGTTDGGYHTLEMSMVPVSVEDDSAGIDIVVQDVSERRRIADELKRSNEELQHFAYIASHDLQEPLRMIASYLKLIERRYAGKLDEDADDFITFAVDGANRLQNMINGLLEFSRVETRGKPFEKVDLEGVLADCLANLEMMLEENEVSITHDPLPAVYGDVSQLVPLMQNLLSNAVKFRKKGEPLKVHVSARKGDDWVISVKDNGIGIDPEYSEQIFTIFQRLHSRDEFPGTGIGLAVCKRIVERHGGKIWVESEPGEGSTFYFTIADHDE